MTESQDDEVLLAAGQLEPVGTILQRLTGRRPHPCTVWRWNRRPGAGGPLPARLVYGVWHSTEAAIRDWLARRSQRPRAPPPDTPSDDSLRQRGLLS